MCTAGHVAPGQGELGARGRQLVAVGERWATRGTHPTSGGAMYAATDSKGRLPICAAVIRNPEAN